MSALIIGGTKCNFLLGRACNRVSIYGSIGVTIKVKQYCLVRDDVVRGMGSFHMVFAYTT